MYRIKIPIKKNDIVMVMTGKEKGKSGKVLRLLPEQGKAIVERVNFVKRHARPSQKMRQGGILEKESPLPVSNLRILCPKCNKSIRVGKKRLEDGSKVRVCNKCGDILDK
jgi:large subunit ribosomal protein L24